MPYGFVAVFWALALAVDLAYVGRCNELVLLSVDQSEFRASERGRLLARGRRSDGAIHQ